MNTPFASFACEWLDKKKISKSFSLAEVVRNLLNFYGVNYIVFEWRKFLFLKTENLLRCSCTGFEPKVIRTMEMFLCDKIGASEFLFFSIWRENILGAASNLHWIVWFLIAFAFQTFTFEKKMCEIFAPKWKSFFFSKLTLVARVRVYR